LISLIIFTQVGETAYVVVVLVQLGESAMVIALGLVLAALGPFFTLLAWSLLYFGREIASVRVF
jgi:hypothetical protein